MSALSVQSLARIDREMSDPQRSLVYAAALVVDSVLTRDARKFSG